MKFGSDLKSLQLTSTSTDFPLCELIAWLQSSGHLNRIFGVCDYSSPIRFFKALQFIIGFPQKIILSEVYEPNHQKNIFQISTAEINEEQGPTLYLIPLKMDELTDESLCLSLIYSSSVSIRGAIITDGLNCRSYFANILSAVQKLWANPNEVDEEISISRPVLFQNWLGLHRQCIQELCLTYPAEWTTLPQMHQFNLVDLITHDFDFIIAEVRAKENDKGNTHLLKMFVSETEFVSDMATVENSEWNTSVSTPCVDAPFVYTWQDKDHFAEVDEPCSFKPIPIHIHLCPSPTYDSLQRLHGKEIGEEQVNEWISSLRIKLLEHKSQLDGDKRSDAAYAKFFRRRLTYVLFSVDAALRRRVLIELVYELLEVGIHPDSFRMTEHLMN
eukprot:gene29319-38398_t